MLKDVINIIKDWSLRLKNVKTFRYQDNAFNNAQNSFGTYQVYMDDVSLHQINITTNIFTSTFEIYILSQPTKDKDSILDVQDTAYDMAANLIAKIDNLSEYKGILSVHDWSILTVSHYTDDDSAGVKITLVLEIPSPVSLCTLDDNFNDEPYVEKEDVDNEITLKENEVGDIILKPIKLPKRKK